MYPQTVEERLLNAEGEIHGLQRAVANHAAAHQVLNTKLDDLSGQVRALEHEVKTEVVPRLDRIDARLDGLETDLNDVKSGISALLAHFEITPPSS